MPWGPWAFTLLRLIHTETTHNTPHNQWQRERLWGRTMSSAGRWWPWIFFCPSFMCSAHVSPLDRISSQSCRRCEEFLLFFDFRFMALVAFVFLHFYPSEHFHVNLFCRNLNTLMFLERVKGNRTSEPTWTIDEMKDILKLAFSPSSHSCARAFLSSWWSVTWNRFDELDLFLFCLQFIKDLTPWLL